MFAARALAPWVLVVSATGAVSSLAAGGAAPEPATLVAATETSPWPALASLRRTLAREAPLQARFVQTFTPAGFSDGEREEGTLVIDLPRCLRWTYRGESARSYLLCDQTVWSWSPGETVGERYTLENRDAPGLDFLIYDTAEIESRYLAQMENDERGRPRIVLRPMTPSEDVVAAYVTLDAARGRLLELRYQDLDGNENLFVLSDYRRTSPSTALFEPPHGVTWEDP